jgi:hypothetical protein
VRRRVEPTHVAESDVPPEFRVGPLVEIWAAQPERGEWLHPDTAALYTARKRFKQARKLWRVSVGAPQQHDSRPWSFEVEVVGEHADWYRAKLASAGIKPADFPALRSAAEAWLRDR